MKKKLTKRFLSVFVAVMMLLSLLPASAFAAGGDVAQVNGTPYATLDAAVEAATEGATIELLQDCEMTKGFNKTLTFTGGHKITINRQLTSNGEGWMCFGLQDPSRVLTFDGVEVEWKSEVGTTPWLMLSLSGTMNVTNGAKVVFTVDSGSAGNRNAIYMNAGSVINVTNGSYFAIYGNETAGKVGQGIQLDQVGKANINVKGNSSFLIDGTNRGYVNSPTIYVEDSTFTVQNCTSNASNGGNFTAINSTVTYQNNAGHGLSANDVIIENTKFIADNNSLYGVYVNGDFLMDGTSTLTVTGNSAGGDCAGLKLTSAVTDGKVENGAVVTITDNYCSGLSNNGKVTFEEGAKLTITGNYNDKGTSSHGGGVYNSGAAANLTLPTDAVIYNNHAVTDGDDIFNNTTSTITFGPVGTGWALDSEYGDCEHLIDGWYDDSANARWEAHADSEDGNHIVPVSAGTLTGLYALKAAHGADALDKTDYPALDKKVQDNNQTGTVWSDESVSAAAGETINFQLNSNVPKDLTNYLEPEEVEDPEVQPPAINALSELNSGDYILTFHDEMNSNLAFDASSVKVTIGNTELTNSETTQYYTVTTSGLDDGCTFEVTMNLGALYKAEIIDDEDIANATPIVVTYSADLSDEVDSGEFPNEAWVTYEGGTSSHDIVEVLTYAVKVYKYDQSTETQEPLAGAEFTLTGPNGFSAIDTSGTDGYVVFGGLDVGEYTLKETKAPDGYVANKDPFEVEVNSTQAGTDQIVEVKFANSPIPHTGGMGTTMFTVGGAAILAAAGALFVITRRKEEA